MLALLQGAHPIQPTANTECARRETKKEIRMKNGISLYIPYKYYLILWGHLVLFAFLSFRAAFFSFPFRVFVFLQVRTMGIS